MIVVAQESSTHPAAAGDRSTGLKTIKVPREGAVLFAKIAERRSAKAVRRGAEARHADPRCGNGFRLAAGRTGLSIGGTMS